MATFYLDFENGNDSNSGADWANAWLTITSGATAARIAPGDTIKIAKTADPVSLGQNATFTDGSQTVTLTSAVTKKIDDANANDWTVSTNITGGTNTSRKLGSTALTLTPGASFTTGKVAYKAISGGGTQDFSSYQKISFWFRTTAFAAISDGTYKICLCSDSTGDTIVNEINIPATLASTNWRTVTLDYGGALSSSVQSVAIYANSDPGTTAFSINNIFAANNLTLDTLIGPSGDVNYCIQSIDDTTIKIDSNNTSATGRGYSGSAGTETIYYQQPWLPTDSTSQWETLQDQGSATEGYITFSGGWNTSSGLQDGYTVIASTTVGVRGGISSSSLRYLSFDYLKLARFNISLSPSGNFRLDNIIVTGAAYFCSSSNLYDVIISNCKVLNCSTVSSAYPARFYNCEFRNNTLTGLTIGGGNLLSNCKFSNNGSGSIGANLIANSYNSMNIVLRNCLLSDSTEVPNYSTVYINSWITSWDHDQTSGNHYMWSYNTTANWQTTTYQGTDPGAWKINISNSAVSSIAPTKFPVCQVACAASAAVTVTVWVKKDHATNIAAKLVVEDGQWSLPGITETTDTKADDTSWEELSITFTPTEKGVCPIYLYCWHGGGTANVYVGSVTISQA